MLVLSGTAASDSDAEARITRAIGSGAAVEKFRDIIEAQGGDPRVIDSYDRLPAAAHREDWRAPATGVVARLDAELLGRAAVALGAGRDRVDAGVDPSAGIDIAIPLGAQVRAGETVLMLSCADRSRVAAARALIDEAVGIGDAPPPASPLVIDTIGL